MNFNEDIQRVFIHQSNIGLYHCVRGRMSMTGTLLFTMQFIQDIPTIILKNWVVN